MQTSRKKYVISELKAFNKGLSKKLLEEKYCKMAASPFAFYRGTDHLFWADFSEDQRLKKFSSSKTKTWLQGDLHAYNFGSFEDNDGNLVYGLNDFDESIVSDYQFDVWRMAISIVLIARENSQIKKADEEEYVKVFARSYVKQVKNLVGSKKEEKINYTTKMTRGPLKEYLKAADKKNKLARLKMLTKWTVDGKFNFSSPKLGRVSDKERRAIIQAIEGKKNEVSQYRRSLRSRLVGERQNYFHVLDVAERLLAGTGSLGTKRFYVLIEGKKSNGGDDIILDVKHQSRASSYPYLSKDDRPYYSFDNNAHRTVEGFRALSVNVDNHLGWIKLPKLGPKVPSGHYSVRERSPEKEAYPGLVADLKGNNKLSLLKKANFLSMCEQWGEILATSHARSDNDANQARIPYSFEKNANKLLKGKSKEFADVVYQIADTYAKQVAEDHEIFLGWFDTSTCAKIFPSRTFGETKAIFQAKPPKSVGKSASDDKKKKSSGKAKVSSKKHGKKKQIKGVNKEKLITKKRAAAKKKTTARSARKKKTAGMRT